MKYITSFFLIILFSQLQTLSNAAPIIGKQGEKIFGFGQLGDIAVSPDDNQLAAGCSIGLVVWDLIELDTNQIFVLQNEIVNSPFVEYSPNGEYLLSGGYATGIEVWNPENGDYLFTIPEESPNLKRFNISPNSQYVVIITHTSLSIWDIESRKRLQRIEFVNSDFGPVSFTPDNEHIFFQKNGTIQIWNWKEGQIIKTLPGGELFHNVEYSPNGKWIAFSGGALITHVYDAETFEKHHEFQKINQTNFQTSNAFTFSQDGKYLYTVNSDDTYTQWDIANKQEVRTYSNHTDRSISNIEISNDNQRFFTAGFSNPLSIFDQRRDDVIFEIHEFNNYVRSMALSPDETYFVESINSSFLTANLKDAITGEIFTVLSLSNTSTDIRDQRFVPNKINFSNDGNFLLFSGTSQYGRTIIVNVNENLIELVVDSDYRIETSQLSPNNRYLITAERYNENGRLRVWDTLELKLVETIESFISNDVMFLEDNIHAISANTDNSVILFNATNGTITESFDGHNESVVSLDISNNYNFLLTGSMDDTAILWDIENRKIIQQFNRSGSFNEVKFSPDSQYAAISYYAANHALIEIIDLSTGKVLVELNQHTGSVTDLYFTNDNTKLYSSSSDGTTRLWDLSTITNKDSSIQNFILFD